MSYGSKLSKLNNQERFPDNNPFLISFTDHPIELPFYSRIYNIFPIRYNLGITQFVHIIFTTNNKMIPYIQFNNDYNEEIIGFPWKITEENFHEILIYIKKYINLSSIRIYIPLIQYKLIRFLISESLLIKSEIFRHEFEISKLINAKERNDDFYARIATEKDIELLLELFNNDKRINIFFTKREYFIEHIKHKILSQNKIMLVFNNNKLISAASPEVSDKNDEVTLNFYAIRPGFEHSWRSLLLNIAKICKEKRWKEKRLIIYLRGMRYYQNFTEILEEFKPQLSVEGFLFSLNH